MGPFREVVFVKEVIKKKEKRTHPQVIERTAQPKDGVLESRHQQENKQEGHRHNLVVRAPVA